VLEKIANSPTGPNPSMPGENSKPMEWTTLKSVKIMSKSAYQASATGAKKTTKPSEVKSSMGGGTGMDMKAGESKGSTTTEATGHPGADTVNKAKETSQTPSGGETGNGGAGGDETGK